MKQSVGAILLVLVVNVGSLPKRKFYLVDNGETRPDVGKGKIQDVESTSEKRRMIESITEETIDKTIKGSITDILKSAKENLDQKISEGKNITTKEFTDWLETLMNIVEGEKHSKTKKGGKENTKGHLDNKPSEHGSDYADYMAGLDF